MNRRAALEIVHNTLAADCACQPSDLTNGEMTLVEAREFSGRRRLGFTLETFVREQMAEVYRFSGFDYALSYRLDYPSPDMIAVAARYQGKVVGMAGVSADSDQLWQIGIDVVPEYQGIGLGKALVSRATEATLEDGRTPYYTTLLTNIPSGNTARSVGYQWTWTDAYVRDR